MIKEITDQQNCTTCAFCRTFRSEQIIGKVEYKCMRMPPGVIAVPVGMNSQGMQVSIQSVFPPVHPLMICGEWTCQHHRMQTGVYAPSEGVILPAVCLDCGKTFPNPV